MKRAGRLRIRLHENLLFGRPMILLGCLGNLSCVWIRPDFSIKSTVAESRFSHEKVVFSEAK